MMKFVSKIAYLALAVFGLSLLPGNADAGSSPVLDRVIKKKELRVGMSGNQPPFNATSRSNKTFGFEVDMANAIASAMGVKLTIVKKPFGELMSSLNKGEVDMVASGVSITAERTQKASFVGPYMVSGKSILTKTEVLTKVKSAEELNQSKLVVVALENSTSQTFVEKHLPKAKLVKVKDYDVGVEMVLKGKASVMVADMPICVLTMLRHPDKGLATLSQPLTLEPIGLAVSSKDAQFQNILDSYVNTLGRTGILAALTSKWFEDGSWVSDLR